MRLCFYNLEASNQAGTANRKRSTTSISMCSIKDKCYVLWVATCGLDWRQVKRDRLSQHGLLNRLQLFQCCQNCQSFKLWGASSFNMANIIRLGTYSSKVTIYNSVCTQQGSQSWISSLLNTVQWNIYSQAFLSLINHTMIGMLAVSSVPNVSYSSRHIL